MNDKNETSCWRATKWSLFVCLSFVALAWFLGGFDAPVLIASR